MSQMSDIMIYNCISGFHAYETSSKTSLQILIIILYTGCHRRNGPNFGRVFFMLNYTDITQNTYFQS